MGVQGKDPQAPFGGCQGALTLQSRKSGPFPASFSYVTPALRLRLIFSVYMVAQVKAGLLRVKCRKKAGFSRVKTRKNPGFSRRGRGLAQKSPALFWQRGAKRIKIIFPGRAAPASGRCPGPRIRSRTSPAGTGRTGPKAPDCACGPLCA